MAPLSRRHALRLGGSLGVASLAGCSSLPFADQDLTLTIANFNSKAHFLTVELLRANSHTSVYQRKFRLEPPSGAAAASEVQQSNVVESRPYLVRTSLDDVDEAHYHFVPNPDCRGADESDEILIEVRSRGDGERPYVTLLRNGTIRCD